MRDLLAQIRGGSAAPAADVAEGDVESGFVREGNTQLKQFFTSVSEIRGLFGLIRDNVAKLEQLVQAALGVARENELNRYLNQIDGIISELNRHALTARNRLKDMETDNAAFEQNEMSKADPNARNLTDIRTRKTQLDTLNSTFVEVMGEVQRAQADYRAKFRQRMERQYKIAKPDATDAEIEAALDQKKPIFAEQILSSTSQQQRAEAMQLLESIRERHEHIVKLEESLKELRQMFLDMQLLVQQQGEVLNDIEKAVESAVGYTEKGLGEMKKSVKLQKKARKKMCILFCCIIILLAVVLGPTLGVVLPRG